jgi:hypothetical protein
MVLAGQRHIRSTDVARAHHDRLDPLQSPGNGTWPPNSSTEGHRATALAVFSLSSVVVQYELALREWYLGGEWLALSHLYIAVETLAPECLDSHTAEVKTRHLEGRRRGPGNVLEWR